MALFVEEGHQTARHRRADGSLTHDPYWETADIDTSNNAWPRKITPSRVGCSDRAKGDMMKDFNTR
jgi:hypothetical protein